MKPARGVALAIVFCALAAWAGADTSASSPAEFAGVWKLDTGRSDPQSKMFETLALPWYARAAMSSFTPTMTIDVDGKGLRVATSNPIGGDRERELPGDGSEQRGKDPLGRSFRETTKWQPDGSMHIERWIEIDGTTAKVEGVWQRVGADLQIDTVLQRGEEAPVKVHRIFTPVAQDAAAVKEKSS